MGNHRFPINRLLSSASIMQIFVSVSRYTCTPQIMIQINTFSLQCYQCVLKSWTLFIFRAPSNHYDDVLMSAMACQITNLTIVYSTVYSGADQRKRQSSASLAFVRGIHPHKGPVTWQMFPFDDVIMTPMWSYVRWKCCLVLYTTRQSNQAYQPFSQQQWATWNSQ